MGGSRLLINHVQGLKTGVAPGFWISLFSDTGQLLQVFPSSLGPGTGDRYRGVGMRVNMYREW